MLKGTFVLIQEKYEIGINFDCFLIKGHGGYGRKIDTGAFIGDLKNMEEVISSGVVNIMCGQCLRILLQSESVTCCIRCPMIICSKCLAVSTKYSICSECLQMEEILFG